MSHNHNNHNYNLNHNTSTTPRGNKTPTKQYEKTSDAAITADIVLDDSSNSSKNNKNNKNKNNKIVDDDDNQSYSKYKKTNSCSISTMLSAWKSRKEFLLAQCQVAVILLIAYVGNNWPETYPRNDNHDPRMFWVMNGALFIAFLCTLQHDPNASSRGVQLLSRPQTEEWKGWMQWAFIMYHYYRVYYVYNEIRVFVSAYVWMTGFGNFLYFEKSQNYSIDRMVSMWLRINYFPLLLSFCLSVPLELYYVVPLHTAGFFITMATCYIATIFKTKCHYGYWKANGVAIVISLLIHVLFYETPLVDTLLFFGKEYHFRFQADKYSAWVGILSAMFWKRFGAYMQWAYANHAITSTTTTTTPPTTTTTIAAADGTIPPSTTTTTTSSPTPTPPSESTKLLAMWLQRLGGIFLLWMWYYGFGYMSDKFMYNPLHPYIFWMPVAGWLMVRNSSKYLCELHSTALEFFGKITLETYVLQFHVFMCRNVQHIPVILPGANATGPLWLKSANMLLCGCIFVPLALWARKVTIATQLSITELVGILMVKCCGTTKNSSSTTTTTTTTTTDETKAFLSKDSSITEQDTEKESSDTGPKSESV